MKLRYFTDGPSLLTSLKNEGPPLGPLFSLLAEKGTFSPAFKRMFEAKSVKEVIKVPFENVYARIICKDLARRGYAQFFHLLHYQDLYFQILPEEEKEKVRAATSLLSNKDISAESCIDIMKNNKDEFSESTLNELRSILSRKTSLMEREGKFIKSVLG